MNFKNKLLLTLGFLVGGGAVEGKLQAQTSAAATYNIATYFNAHRQEGRLGAGIFTGPVWTPATKKTSFEFNAYAGYTFTGEKSPVRARIGAVAGIAANESGVFEYASPTIRLAPQIKNPRLSLLNNFYIVSTLSIKNSPAVYFGYGIPLTGKGKTSTSVLLDAQRYAP